MAVSHYHTARSDLDQTVLGRRREERHIAVVPDGAPEEIRQIFAKKGFTGSRLGDVLGSMGLTDVLIKHPVQV